MSVLPPELGGGIDSCLLQELDICILSLIPWLQGRVFVRLLRISMLLPFFVKGLKLRQSIPIRKQPESCSTHTIT